MKVQGFSHVTINVRSLEQSLAFYRDLLGMRVIHKGNKDAYLEWGSAWICLLDRPDFPAAGTKHIGTDHIAFYIQEEDFHEAVQELIRYNVPIVRGPVQRGGGWAINFLDPDETELELHTSTLQERMKSWA
ncbi:glutathione transferase [Paenibacillus sambharensis]|uniref:Glutathione transferase n=1 Tax=Paenibacillus sambharensis TaxID=1803190 RepID=A0A2W1M0T5_9BACL|nr:VOC family protein [Paenibacillus sambharensis]PZD97327.1 glutathione transferase [Paenibacillus sambharensis]